MRYTRVYTGPDGETHFEEAETAGETVRAVESEPRRQRRVGDEPRATLMAPLAP